MRTATTIIATTTSARVAMISVCLVKPNLRSPSRASDKRWSDCGGLYGTRVLRTCGPVASSLFTLNSTVSPGGTASTSVA